jgi:hypothetical protein
MFFKNLAKLNRSIIGRLDAAPVAKPPAIGNGHHHKDLVWAGCVGDRHRYRVEMWE